MSNPEDTPYGGEETWREKTKKRAFYQKYPRTKFYFFFFPLISGVDLLEGGNTVVTLGVCPPPS